MGKESSKYVFSITRAMGSLSAMSEKIADGYSLSDSRNPLRKVKTQS